MLLLTSTYYIKKNYIYVKNITYIFIDTYLKKGHIGARMLILFNVNKYWWHVSPFHKQVLIWLINIMDTSVKKIVYFSMHINNFKHILAKSAEFGNNFILLINSKKVTPSTGIKSPIVIVQYYSYSCRKK